MKKVLLLCPIPPPYAGPEVASEILLRHLHGEKIIYIHLNSSIRKENWQKGKFDFSGFLKFSLKYIQFLNLIMKSEIEIVYLLLSSSKIGFIRDSIYILTAKFLNKNIVTHYRGGNFNGFYNKCGIVFKKSIRVVLKRIDIIIVQAEILKKMLNGITGTKVVMLYNGLESSGIATKKVFNKDKTVLLFLGHIAFSKGFHTLINVYKNLYRKYKLELIFAGTIRYEGQKSKTQRAFLNDDILKFYDCNHKDISSQISEFVANDKKYNAKYLGIISGSEKEDAFNSSDIFILPSFTEGFSVSVLESMKKGLPIITTKVGALPEIIKEEENGWLCNSGDYLDLERAIVKAISHRYNWEMISQNNIKDFINKYTIEQIAYNFNEIIESIP